MNKKNFSVADMKAMEKELRSKLDLYELSADDSQLSEKLRLKVEYVTDMTDDNEAELLPIDDDNYYGLIRLSKELEEEKFAYIHEIIHYIFDVGYEKKVTKSFARKRKGKTNSPDEQRTNYMTAAFIMPYDQIKKSLEDYDGSHPKLDELVFVRNLQERYVPDRVAVIRRIAEVRKMMNSEKNENMVS